MYTDYYGLSGRPFALTPDPRFYFDSSSHKTAMAYLGYGLAQGEGFIAITGEPGTGKTTLVGHLMATIDKARLNVIKLVSTQVDGDDMLRLAAQALGLATEGLAKAQLLDRIERTLRSLAAEGRRTLLIVDEAQNLPVSSLEELRMLSNFQAGERALMQIFLLGQPEFRERLQHSDRLEQLRQRVIATHHLAPMGLDEIEAYVTHRLALVGWDGRPAFTADAFAALHRHSDGIPRRLNTLANRVLLSGALEELDTISGETVDAVAADLAADAPDSAEEATADVRQMRRATDAEPWRETVAAPVHAATVDPHAQRRIAALEERLEEQDAALRRVLTMLIDWVERDGKDAPAEEVEAQPAKRGRGRSQAA
ncbi:MAG: AAA family ATPase [Sphingomonadaceae bacterium]|nr:AAA family ATPase [Sphingomonadaceae bacterium]